MNDTRSNVIQIHKFSNKADADAVRDKKLKHFLYRMLDTLKAQTNIAAQINSGLLEFESFITALTGGGYHPSLESWIHSRVGTPPADAGELRARRHIVLLVIALERSCTNMSAAAARRLAAKEVMSTRVFPGETITAKSIEHWQERQFELTPQDEQVLATAIASIGPNSPARMALHFISLAHLNHNPTAMIVQEDNS